MQKIETIWHHLLWEAIKKGQFQQTQKALATKFGYSLSTVNLAVRRAAEVGAIRVSGKFFTLNDAKKLLYFWATHRKLTKDIIYRTYIDKPVFEIEGLIPPEAIFAAYGAARRILKEAPADYAKVYFYIAEDRLGAVKKRFPPADSNPNLFVLKSYPKQGQYGEITSLPQTFVDIWNLSDWYAKDFTLGLERKIDELLP